MARFGTADWDCGRVQGRGLVWCQIWVRVWGQCWASLRLVPGLGPVLVTLLGLQPGLGLKPGLGLDLGLERGRGRIWGWVWGRGRAWVYGLVRGWVRDGSGFGAGSRTESGAG